ncbi:MAG: dipeptidyl carboxypeptidase II, partial [Myxococcales bacterium]|nr:dipeptidyl carboxypeptidase II [Myxococcales bacterium]
MRQTSLLTLVSLLLATACSHTQPADPQPDMKTDPVSVDAPADDNPLFVASPLPYQAPNFAAIELGHYRPAFERGMEEQLAEVAAIVANEEAPTFENTVVALERSGAILRRTGDAFFSISGTISNDEIQAIEAEMAPKLAAHSDAIELDAGLFARIDAVYQAREGLTGEDLRLVEETHERFVRAGAKLD